MPAIPREPLPLDSAHSQRPHAIPSFASDTAERIRLRSDDCLPLDTTSSPLQQRSPGEADWLSDIQNPPQSSRQLARRQTLPPIPLSYPGLNTSPSAGTIVGIVLGVVLGYLLLFWLVVAVINSRGVQQTYVEGDDTEIVVRRDRRRSKHSHRSHRNSRQQQSEMSEQSSRPAPSRSQRQESSRPRTERIIIQETRREPSRPPGAPSEGGVREDISIHINENRASRAPSRVPGDDHVEVIAEESQSNSTAPPEPKRKSRTGNVRHVDPNQYAGGNFPTHKVDIDVGRSRSRK